ncbi:MAG: DUF5110 domain-containing protein, partial [Lachnospiraceae bacterium]|nr:DUF5110 domain-containing protein [Lachnospiraceae bacterium]
YNDDGISNAFEEGAYRRTRIRMSGGETVHLDFESEGSYDDTVETVEVTMIRKEKSPLFVKLGDETLPRFLDRAKFEAAACGWYYSETGRAAVIRYPNPKKDIRLTVSFREFDLLGM